MSRTHRPECSHAGNLADPFCTCIEALERRVAALEAAIVTWHGAPPGLHRQFAENALWKAYLADKERGAP